MTRAPAGDGMRWAATGWLRRCWWLAAILCCLAPVQGTAQESAAAIGQELVEPSGQELVEASGQELNEASGPEIGAETEPVVRAQAPKDFVDLLEPQTNYVDVFYGGVKVASTLATFTPEYVQFADPLQVVGALTDITAPEEVLMALSGPLETNGALICLPGESEECGVLVPEIAGVIFDRNRFRVDVFVHPDNRAVGALEMGRHLEPTDTGPGVVSGLRGVASGGNEQDQEYSLRNDTIIAYMDNRVDTALLFDSQDGFFLDGAVAEADRGDWRGTAGLFRTAGLDAAPQEKIVGFGIGTQLDTRVDLDLAYATPLILFLPNRAKIDIFRNGRLLSTGIYEAGNQTIDTSDLPNGSYDITLRIQEIGGSTTEETRFFSKNPELPPADTPIHILQLGALVDDDKTNDGTQPFIGTVESVPILRAGTLHRLGENWGAFADVMASDTELLLEIGGLLRERPARLRGSLIGTTAQDIGYTFSYSDRVDDLGFNVSLRQIYVKEETEANPAEFDPFTASSIEFGGGVNYSIPDTTISLGLSGSYNDRESESSWSIGPTANALLWQTSSYDYRFNASVTQSNLGLLAISQLVISFRQGNWSALAAGGYRIDTADDSGGSGVEGNANVSWQKNWDDGRQFQFNTGVFQSPLQTSLTANVGYVDPLGVVTLSYDRGLDDNDTTYAGEIDVDLIGNMDGVAVTGFGGSDSAVLVQLEGDIPEDAVFEVYIGGSLQALVEEGGTTPIVLEPYETYDVSLLARSDDLFDYELEAQRVTLFPGSVATLTWQVVRILPVFGRAVFADGTPVALARIEGAHGVASTDADGYFQAEVNGTRQLDFFTQEHAPCHVPIENLPPSGVFFDLGTMVCQP